VWVVLIDLQDAQMPLAISFTVDQFSLFTTDPKWMQAFYSDASTIYKVASVQNLASYWLYNTASLRGQSVKELNDNLYNNVCRYTQSRATTTTTTR
jgi:hypothetical protein